MASVDIAIRMNIAGGTPIEQSWNDSVAAIDDISFELAGSSSDQAVNIQPGPAAQIVFLAIANVATGPGVSYSSTAGGTPIQLATIHAYSGPGMASLLSASPTTLYFSNSSPDPAQIRVVVARQI